LQKKVTDGLDLIVIVLVGPMLVNLIANLISPGVLFILHVIGTSVTTATQGNPIFMGAILGMIIPIVG
jgi:uncharacterized membrane protein